MSLYDVLIQSYLVTFAKNSVFGRRGWIPGERENYAMSEPDGRAKTIPIVNNDYVVREIPIRRVGEPLRKLVVYEAGQAIEYEFVPDGRGRLRLVSGRLVRGASDA